MNTISAPLLVSALGGAVAALILRAAYLVLRKFLKERRPVAEYHCAEPVEKRPNILVGLLAHGKGEPVVDPSAVSKRAWQHSPHPPSGEIERLHTLYGPYVNDFGKPGYYKVRFRIYGRGFSPHDRHPVLILDIIQRPKFMDDQNLILLGQRVIRGSELRSRYRGFDVYCYVSGNGIFEYRCLVIPENFDHAKHTLRFDTIKVFVHLPP